LKDSQFDKARIENEYRYKKWQIYVCIRYWRTS
jgi:hypothetical protein